MANPSGIVTLTTDFGSADSYVAQMKAVIASIHPEARVVDVTHEASAVGLDGVLFATESAWPHFPAGSVHVVVVDPGVGSDRRLIAVETAAAWLVGPDTGVLSSGLPTSMRVAAAAASTGAPGDETTAVALGKGVKAVEIGDSPVRAAKLSTTFHGRDIMAPVAAHLVAGTPMDELGTPVASVMAASALDAPVVCGAGTGRILHIDRFGNAITSFRAGDASAAFEIEVGATRVTGPTANYQSGRKGGGGHPVALFGSAGYIEIAWPNGSAAERLGLQLGDRVKMRPR